MDNKIKDYYRTDIDGLRAIAVLAVIFFHFGFFSNGYLGVDVFFVISGYLITTIVYRESKENKFSVTNFYIRRVRRIIPLVLLILTLTIVIGVIVMLPDDLENLAQSVVATNFFANNILQLITTHDYWNIVNEYKPLMHTWSLGVEEQFYFIYPILFLIFGNSKKVKYILPLLILLSAISVLLFFFYSDTNSKFYLIQYRFWELSFGGIGAILTINKNLNGKYKFAFLISLLSVFFIRISNDWKILFAVLTTLGLLITSNKNQDKFSSFILENKLMIFIGKISFSLYMWHQVVLAFYRYTISDSITIEVFLLLFIIIIIFSILSYYFVEQIFRDKKIISLKLLLSGVLFLSFATTAISLIIYKNAGVVNDVPELEITKNNVKRNMHALYNDRIYKLDKNFTDVKKVKILIIGNSFARDWANILLESKYRDKIEISYVFDIYGCKDIKSRLNMADYIYLSESNEISSNLNLKQIIAHFSIDMKRTWIIGTKNFGKNNGVIYNNRHKPNYCEQRINMREGYLEGNYKMKTKWGDKYIDLIGLIIDKNGNIPVFTPDCKFISQDCSHLTHAGAEYFAKLIENKIKIE
ncbi:acyltransferase family protein [Flavobacterium humidisoli]|uniref:Acyltransferase n=1 Tax=Flavobacterium humidisoli TaxID=2937442 RepID=A0ABY4LWQ5_9FLAO|nr:acyltransferase [Flavobacterium humidisoli]UPZ16061.1 acyltransferase [Flavobacterium humidisoli]